MLHMNCRKATVYAEIPLKPGEIVLVCNPIN